MNKDEIKDFFDECAPFWDDDMIRDDTIINQILDNAEIRKDNDILDVACGTGVLIPDYLKRGVKSVTGIDISPKMLEIAKKKFSPLHQVSFICDDAETYDYEKKFDNIVIYNAFPHFPDPKALITHLSKYLKVGGTLTVAHGMGRAKINHHHSGGASKVSMELMDTKELCTYFEGNMDIAARISEETMYQVTGKLTS